MRESAFEIFRDFFHTAKHGNVGTRLYYLFVEAGFSFPECYAEYPIDGGPDSPVYEWFDESLRSILPRAEALASVSSKDVDIDTLARPAATEAIALKIAFPGPAIIGCFARKL